MKFTESLVYGMQELAAASADLGGLSPDILTLRSRSSSRCWFLEIGLSSAKIQVSNLSPEWQLSREARGPQQKRESVESFNHSREAREEESQPYFPSAARSSAYHHLFC